MDKVSLFTTTVFIVTTVVTGWLFWTACGRSKLVLAIIAVWLSLTASMALAGFFLVTDTTPPRFLLLTAPPLISILLLFTTKKGKKFMQQLQLEPLVLLHTVRIPVELVLHALFIAALMPRIMTYEGLNLDIFSGITAPIIYYFGYVKHRLSSTMLITWNLVCLGLLINIVAIAILSAPLPFQQLAFDQPNIGVFYFPFVWLPGFIVPIVLLAHIVSLQRIFKNKKK